MRLVISRSGCGSGDLNAAVVRTGNIAMLLDLGNSLAAARCPFQSFIGYHARFKLVWNVFWCALRGKVSHSVHYSGRSHGICYNIKP